MIPFNMVCDAARWCGSRLGPPVGHLSGAIHSPDAPAVMPPVLPRGPLEQQYPELCAAVLPRLLDAGRMRSDPGDQVPALDFFVAACLISCVDSRPGAADPSEAPEAENEDEAHQDQVNDVDVEAANQNCCRQKGAFLFSFFGFSVAGQVEMELLLDASYQLVGGPVGEYNQYEDVVQSQLHNLWTMYNLDEENGTLEQAQFANWCYHNAQMRGLLLNSSVRGAGG